MRSNRSAIGARIRVDISEGGTPRSIDRTVGTGGRFGCNPLRQEIGLGKAEKIDAIEVSWPTGKTRQTFRAVAADPFIAFTEGREAFRPLELKRIPFHE